MSTELTRPPERLDAEWVAHSQLLPNDWNPNGMSSQKQEELIQSILTNGWTAPILIDEDNTIIDGEQRWHAAYDARIQNDADLTPDGVDSGYVPVFRLVEHTEEEKVIATLQQNLSGEHDDERMGELFEGLRDDGVAETARDLMNLKSSDVDDLIDNLNDTTTETETTEAENQTETTRIDADKELMNRFTVEVSDEEHELLSTVLGEDLPSERLLKLLKHYE